MDKPEYSREAFVFTTVQPLLEIAIYYYPWMIRAFLVFEGKTVETHFFKTWEETTVFLKRHGAITDPTANTLIAMLDAQLRFVTE